MEGRGLGRCRNSLDRRLERASIVLGLRVTEVQLASCVLRNRLLKMGPGSDRVRVLMELMAMLWPALHDRASWPLSCGCSLLAICAAATAGGTCSKVAAPGFAPSKLHAPAAAVSPGIGLGKDALGPPLVKSREARTDGLGRAEGGPAAAIDPRRAAMRVLSGLPTLLLASKAWRACVAACAATNELRGNVLGNSMRLGAWAALRGGVLVGTSRDCRPGALFSEEESDPGLRAPAAMELRAADWPGLGPILQQKKQSL